MYVINYFPFDFDYYFPFVYKYFPFGYKYFPFGFDYYFPFAFDYYFPFAFDYFPRITRKLDFILNRMHKRVCEYVNRIPDLDSVLNDD